MTTYNKGMTLEQFTYTNYGVSLTSQQKRQALSEFIAHEKSNKIATYETGATSHAVNELILFTDNTRELAEKRDSIYQTLVDFKMECRSDKFKSLFKSAIIFYAREFGDKNSHHIMSIRMDGPQYNEFCQLYANDFDNWKLEHGYK